MDRHHDAARLLLSARRDPSQRLHSLPEAMRPKTDTQATLVQRAIIAELGPIGGWKVGSPSPDGRINCSPLPASGIGDSPMTASGMLRGVEAEIGVRFAQGLPPREQPYSADEVLAAVGSMHPIMEVLDSRYLDADAVDPLSNLADSMSHGGLAVGAPIESWRDVDLATERVRLLVDGAEVKARTANPAGGMVRLLVWLANEGTRWAGGLQAGQVATTGSWTGKDFVPEGGEARAVFARCGEAVVRFG